MGGVEFVKAVNDQQPQVATEVGIILQGQRGQPALAFGVHPVGLHQPVLVLSIDGSQFGQPFFSIGDGDDKVVAVDTGALEFPNESTQESKEAGFFAQRGIVAQAAFFAQLVYDGAQQAVLDGIEQAGDGPSSPGQDFGVEGVEGTQLHPQRAALLSQATAKGRNLGLIGQDDPDGGQRICCSHFLDTSDAVVGFTLSSGSQENTRRHISSYLAAPSCRPAHGRTPSCPGECGHPLVSNRHPCIPISLGRGLSQAPTFPR